MKHMRFKAILSCLLLLIFCLLFVSGIMLHLGRTGLILGLSRAFLIYFHARLSLLMTALIVCHVVLNRRLFYVELTKLFKRGAALVEDNGVNRRAQQ